MRLFAQPSDLTYFWASVFSFFGSALFFLYCFTVWAFQGAGEALIDRVTAFSAISLGAAIFTAVKASSKDKRVVFVAIANSLSVIVLFGVWTVWAKGDVHPVVMIVGLIYMAEIYLAVMRYRQLSSLPQAVFG